MLVRAAAKEYLLLIDHLTLKLYILPLGGRDTDKKQHPACHLELRQYKNDWIVRRNLFVLKLAHFSTHLYSEGKGAPISK